MKIGDVEVRDDVFGVKVKKHVLWEVVKWQLASRRQGTHSTKTRGEVAYSGRKILPQKGTGHARRGDRGANILVGGGVAHRNGAILFVENIDLGDKPKTKEALRFLKSIGVSSEKVLIVLPSKDEVIYKSFRNLPNVRVLTVEGLNVYDILWSDRLVLIRSALAGIYKRVET